MNILIKIVILISIILFIYSIFQYIRGIVFLKKISKRSNIQKSKKELYIIIPCLREQNCIKETIEYFKKVIDKNTSIIIATTKKENHEYETAKLNLINDIKNKMSNQKILKKYSWLGLTEDILKNLKNKKDIDKFFNNIKNTTEVIEEEILPYHKNIYLIEYPLNSGYMADQLNYVLDNFEKITNKKITDNTYISIYNADSRPQKNTFAEFINNTPDNIEVAQQYSYALKNYDDINWILKGFALYQSNFEIKTGIINTFFNSKFLYTHVVGHGLFMKLNFIKSIGSFNTTFWCEDIFLTMYLKYKNINIYPLMSLENMETANSLKSLIKQNAVWFKSTSDFYKMFKSIFKKERKISFSGLIGAFNELRCAINWLCFPFVILFIIIIPIITGHIYLSFINIIIFFMYTSLYTLSTILVINSITKENYKIDIKMLFYVFMSTLISNIGPLYSIIYNPKNKYKTER